MQSGKRDAQTQAVLIGAAEFHEAAARPCDPRDDPPIRICRNAAGDHSRAGAAAIHPGGGDGPLAGPAITAIDNQTVLAHPPQQARKGIDGVAQRTEAVDVIPLNASNGQYVRGELQEMSAELATLHHESRAGPLPTGAASAEQLSPADQAARVVGQLQQAAEDRSRRTLAVRPGDAHGVGLARQFPQKLRIGLLHDPAGEGGQSLRVILRDGRAVDDPLTIGRDIRGRVTDRDLHTDCLECLQRRGIRLLVRAGDAATPVPEQFGQRSQASPARANEMHRAQPGAASRRALESRFSTHNGIPALCLVTKFQLGCGSAANPSR